MNPLRSPSGTRAGKGGGARQLLAWLNIRGSKTPKILPRQKSPGALREARRLAKIVFLLGIGVLGGVVLLRLYSALFLAGAAVAGTSIFLLQTRTHGNGPADPPTRLARRFSPREIKRLRSLSTMAFFLLTAASLIAAVQKPYAKPALYYVLAAASAAALTARIALLERPPDVPLTVAMLAVLTLNLFGSNQLAFPLGIGGADALVAPIAATGTVPGGSCGGTTLIYFFFPASHVYVASSAIVMTTSPVNTYYLMGLLGMVFSVVILFALVRPLIGTRRALFASAFLAGSSYYLFWASHASATTFAIPLIATLVLILRELRLRRNRQMIAAAAVLSLSLVLTHPYSSVIFVLILLGILAGQVYARRWHDVWAAGLIASAAVFLGILLFDWTNFSCLVPIALRFVQQYVGTLLGPRVLSSPGTYDALPLGILFINTFADSMLLTLSILGFLLLYARGLSKSLMLIVGPAILLLAVTLIGLVANLVYLLPARVYSYLQFIGLAPLAAVGIATLYRGGGDSHGAERNPLRILLILGVVAVFVFGSTASTIAGFETSPLTGGRPFVKVYDTQVEVASANWLCAHLTSARTLEVSRSMAGLPYDQVGRCAAGVGGQLGNLPVTANGTINMTRIKSGSYVWFSWFDVSTIFQYKLVTIGRYGGATYAQLKPTAPDSLQGFDRVYDSGQIQVFLNQTGAG